MFQINLIQYKVVISRKNVENMQCSNVFFYFVWISGKHILPDDAPMKILGVGCGAPEKFGGVTVDRRKIYLSKQQ